MNNKNNRVDFANNLAFRKMNEGGDSIDLFAQNNNKDAMEYENFRLSDSEADKFYDTGLHMSNSFYDYARGPEYDVGSDPEFREKYFGKKAPNRDVNLELFYKFQHKNKIDGIGSFSHNMRKGQEVLERARDYIIDPVNFPDLSWHEETKSWRPTMSEGTKDYIESNAVLRDRHETDFKFAKMKFAKFTKEYLDLVEDGYINPKKVNKLAKKYNIPNIYNINKKDSREYRLENTHSNYYPPDKDIPSWIREYQQKRMDDRIIDR